MWRGLWRALKEDFRKRLPGEINTVIFRAISIIVYGVLGIILAHVSGAIDLLYVLVVALLQRTPV